MEPFTSDDRPGLRRSHFTDPRKSARFVGDHAFGRSLLGMRSDAELNQILVQERPYSPVLTNGGTGSTEHAHYSTYGNVVRVAYARAFTAAGAAGSLALPVPISFGGNTGSYETVGFGYWYDASVPNHKQIIVRRQALTQTVEFITDGGVTFNVLGTDLANGDAIRIKFDYEWR